MWLEILQSMLSKAYLVYMTPTLDNYRGGCRGYPRVQFLGRKSTYPVSSPRLDLHAPPHPETCLKVAVHVWSLAAVHDPGDGMGFSVDLMQLISFLFCVVSSTNLPVFSTDFCAFSDLSNHPHPQYPQYVTVLVTTTSDPTTLCYYDGCSSPTSTRLPSGESGCCLR